ncbi:EAL domain-containing protein, partial [Lacticaseibacillus porcinae]|uniref:EAL domain-containing protein n=1 Tax=Lacticaseibacillus porcinae TaxID=1123687 RepID=UPI001CDD4654
RLETLPVTGAYSPRASHPFNGWFLTVEYETQPKGGSALITYTYFTQAIVDSKTQQPSGYELLLRAWNAEQNAWLLPHDFEITVKMQMRMMKHVLRNLPIKNVSINLTAKQFAAEDTMQQLITFAGRTPDLGNLTVELTQAPTLEEIQTIGQQYRQSGIGLALDDVGTDLDDFELVKQLTPHVDMLKYALQNMRDLDRVAEAPTDIPRWKALANDAGVDFTLEGIESFQDVQLAHHLGINWLQGFYFSRPAEKLQTSENTPLL